MAVKSGLAGGAIYYSKELGVWGDSNQSTKLYNCICKQMSPYTKQVSSKIPVELPYLPTTGEVRYLTKHYYNAGVKNTIHFVQMFPCYVGQYTSKGINAVKSALDAPPPSS